MQREADRAGRGHLASCQLSRTSPQVPCFRSTRVSRGLVPRNSFCPYSNNPSLTPALWLSRRASVVPGELCTSPPSPPSSPALEGLWGGEGVRRLPPGPEWKPRGPLYFRFEPLSFHCTSDKLTLVSLYRGRGSLLPLSPLPCLNSTLCGASTGLWCLFLGLTETIFSAQEDRLSEP